MFITFFLEGRFANNLFQYLATKILQHFLPYHSYSFNEQSNFATLFENQTFILLQDLEQNKINPSSINYNIQLRGFFQNSLFLLHYFPLIKNILHINNYENINKEHTVSSLVKSIQSFRYITEENFNDLFIHIRLDDFSHQKNNSRVIHYNSYLNLIKDLPFTNIVIIRDLAKTDWERKYLKIFEEELAKINKNVSYKECNMLEDFSKMVNCANLICSNSSYSWLAALIGIENKKLIYLPNITPDGQNFYKLPNSKTYKIEYLNDTKFYE